MATKTANVTARVQPEVKRQAEEVLEQLGIPVSVLIDSLYRQIIITKGIPYTMTLQPIATLDTISNEQLDSMLKKGLSQAKSGKGYSLDEAFEKIRADI